MYRLTPKEKMSEGFYAVHFGGLENTFTIEASMGNVAYDIVIGKIVDYKSPEEILRFEAESLLKLINTYFNNKDYSKLKDVYRPDGRMFSDAEWDDFTRDLNTWRNNAGKITESKIVKANTSDNEGMFQLQTIYENKGQQSEMLVIRKIAGKFYITTLK